MCITIIITHVHMSAVAMQYLTAFDFSVRDINNYQTIGAKKKEVEVLQEQERMPVLVPRYAIITHNDDVVMSWFTTQPGRQHRVIRGM